MPAMTNRRSSAPRWWGGRAHIALTLVVFIVLASLDNAAAAIIPAMVPRVTEDLGTSEAAIGALTAAVILITALTATAWGYWGDRGSRKRLLFIGTLIWSVGAWLSSTADSFGQLFLYQAILAVGLGSIASVGFSVVSDFVSPRRRGLAMSFWGLSQGIGGLAGGLLASQAGADDFRTPLAVIAVLGLGFALLYLLTFEAPRGFREPELAELHATGGDYEYRIDRSQIPELAKTRTNIWLIIQGLSAQVAYGSLLWVPLLYQEKVIAEGYSTSTAIKVGGLLGAAFQLGGLFSIVAGHIGDRLQHRSLSGRAWLSAIGILGAIPFFLAFFFMPLNGLDVTDGATTATLVPEVLNELVTNPWVAAAFLLSLLALAFTGADSPNWLALISDVNLPEHRGTVFGLGNLANGIGRGAGYGLSGGMAGALAASIPAPLNWAITLATFQAFFLPSGYCYWKAAGTSPGDILEVRQILAERGTVTVTPPRHSGS
jgi:MFS family permease